MNKLLIILAVILSSAIGYSYWDINPYKPGQVIGIATADPTAYLLEMTEHISLATRPEETFPFPIAIGEMGPAQSLYSGPKQYPFYCMSDWSGHGQPVVDNQVAEGVKIFALDAHGEKTSRVIGYSRDCSLATKINYFYRNSINQKIAAYSTDKPPADQSINRVMINDQSVPEIYRVEHGTINRFIYVIAMLADPAKGRQDKSLWNNRLVYQFQGGSGIGFRQGKESGSHIINKRSEQLKLGYAVITSSANKTSYTYNMLLAEDTAMRVKRQFIALYGDPLYTVGVGGSGGGLSQYLLGQNGTDLLDALLPLYSYPDMISQTIYALDCDLLNTFYAYRSEQPNLFDDWTLRSAIEGMNARNSHDQRIGFLTPMNMLLDGQWPQMPKGNSECINGWFGLSTYINNPLQGFLRPYFAQNVLKQVKWNYWEDLTSIFGRRSDGFTKTTWDNVGVQYGLEALKNGRISVATFFDLNSKIGGWREQPMLQAEKIGMLPLIKLPLWLSLWGNHNVTELRNGLAARHQGDISAINSAYRSGQVFIGKLTLPTLDIRHYLEDDLDMHHVSASFNTRLRIMQQQGHANNQVIWVSHKNFSPVVRGFAVMDQWMANIRQDPEHDVVASKPAQLLDSCFDVTGQPIATGNQVWNGQWNDQPAGACNKVYPMYSTVRIAAGAPWEASIFKCYLQDVEQAITQGVYGTIMMENHLTKLKAVFPDGVCDYHQGDAGRPVMAGIFPFDY